MVGGSIVGRLGAGGGHVQADALGAATIRGDVGGAMAAEFAGRIVTGPIASLTIGGSLIGGYDDDPYDATQQGRRPVDVQAISGS